jgi:predicted O-methyltransferase YrrM
MMASHEDIEGWFHHDQLFAAIIATLPEGARLVEVGSYKGKSAVFIATQMEAQDRGMSLTCVDHWEGSDEPDHHADEDVRSGRLFEVFMENIAGFQNIEVVREASPFAASFFENDSIDFLYLDAAHDRESVAADIEAWWPKVAPGGWMIGDDYLWPGVKEAVRGAFPDEHEAIGMYPAWVVRKAEADQGESQSVVSDGKSQAEAGAGQAQGQQE